MKGARVVEVVDSKNNDPEACYSKTEREYAKSNFAAITFTNGWEKVVCYGYSTYEFMPGLVSNSRL